MTENQKQVEILMTATNSSFLTIGNKGKEELCVQVAREKAGLPWLNSYTFRHYGISKMLMAGIDRFTVQQWTGHKSSKMFDEVYGHLQPDHGAPEMAKLKLPI